MLQECEYTFYCVNDFKSGALGTSPVFQATRIPLGLGTSNQSDRGERCQLRQIRVA
jgi:hypothetical protein